MPIANEWATAETRQIRRQRNGLKRLLSETTLQIGKSESALEGLRSLKTDLEETLQRANRDLSELNLMREDPVVLIRDTGAGGYAYHDAERPCGWVRDRANYVTMLWGVARNQGFTACTSCGWRPDHLAGLSTRRSRAQARAT